mgnify:CR=1 FL=1|tara:strand:- start:1801 stop:2064 length:264 start_codon:yes stop_codon:yes gene_type:complete
MSNFLDPFLTFVNIQPDETQILEKYNSPDSETSFLKDVPIDLLGKIKKILKKGSVEKFRIVYRGPRSGGMASYCLKQNAKRFAVYGV